MSLGAGTATIAGQQPSDALDAGSGSVQVDVTGLAATTEYTVALASALDAAGAPQGDATDLPGAGWANHPVLIGAFTTDAVGAASARFVTPFNPESDLRVPPLQYVVVSPSAVGPSAPALTAQYWLPLTDPNRPSLFTGAPTGGGY